MLWGKMKLLESKLYKGCSKILMLIVAQSTVCLLMCSLQILEKRLFFSSVTHYNSQSKSLCEDPRFLWIFAEGVGKAFRWDSFLLCVSLTTELFLSRVFPRFSTVISVFCGVLFFFSSSWHEDQRLFSWLLEEAISCVHISVILM